MKTDAEEMKAFGEECTNETLEALAKEILKPLTSGELTYEKEQALIAMINSKYTDKVLQQHVAELKIHLPGHNVFCERREDGWYSGGIGDCLHNDMDPRTASHFLETAVAVCNIFKDMGVIVTELYE